MNEARRALQIERQRRVVSAIRAGGTLESVAKLVGVSGTTVYRLYTQATGEGLPSKKERRVCPVCDRVFYENRSSEQKTCSPNCGHEIKRKYNPALLTFCAFCEKPITVTAKQQIERKRNMAKGLVKHCGPDDWHCSRYCASRHGKAIKAEREAQK